MTKEAEHYSPEAISVIGQMLKAAETERDDALVGAIIYGPIAQTFGGVYLDEIESILRSTNSIYYLVATPVKLVKKDPITEGAYLPQTGYERNPYAVSVCIGENGVARADKEYNLHYAPKQNLENLKNTGFLMPPPGERWAETN